MMQPTQSEILVEAVLQDRRREAARRRATPRRDVPSWRRSTGSLLVRTGLMLQGAARTGVAGQAPAPRLAPDGC